MIQLNDGDDTSIFQKLSSRSYGKNNKTKKKQKIITNFLMFLIKRNRGSWWDSGTIS